MGPDFQLSDLGRVIHGLCASVCNSVEDRRTHLLGLQRRVKELRDGHAYSNAWHTVSALIVFHVHNFEFQLLKKSLLLGMKIMKIFWPKVQMLLI